MTRTGAIESFAITFYQIEPYPNEFSVHVIDSRSRKPVEGAHIELSHSFGGSTLKTVTGVAGVACFSNLRLGMRSASVPRLDHEGDSSSLEMSSTGRVILSSPIVAQPQRRLYLSVIHFGAGPAATVAGIDRASGLRSDATLRIGDWNPDISLKPSTGSVFFEVPVEISRTERAAGQGGSL